MARKKLSELLAGGPNNRANPIQPMAAVEDKVGLQPSDETQGALPRYLRGVVRSGVETGPLPILRALGKMGWKTAGDAAEHTAQHIKDVPLGDAGKAGEMTGDVGMMLASPLKGILGSAVQGVAQHQMQNYGKTGEVNPEAALDEAALSTAIPFAGGKFGPMLKKAGVNVLNRGLQIPRKLMEGANPPNLKHWLENRMSGYFGGAEKVANDLGGKGGKLSQLDEARNTMLDDAGVNLNHPDVMRKTGEKVRELENASKINVGEGAKMNGAADQARENAARRASNIDEQGYPITVPGRASIDLRKLADKNAKYDANLPVPPPAARFNQIYRNQIEDQLEGKMAGVPEYTATRKSLKTLTPLNEAAEYSLAKPHAPLTWGDMMVAKGTAGTGIAAKRLFATPGGAQMLYDLGRVTDSKIARKGGRAALNLARSYIYTPKD